MLINPLLVTPAFHRKRKKHTKIFVNPSKNTNENERKGKNRQEVCDNLSVCVLKLRLEVNNFLNLVALSNGKGGR